VNDKRFVAVDLLLINPCWWSAIIGDKIGYNCLDTRFSKSFGIIDAILTGL
jgi:hypothetical protein